MSRERDHSREDTEPSTPADVLGIFEVVDGPVVTSGDVADTLDCSRETARRKLRSLEDAGHVASRKTAGRVVWWLVADHEPVRAISPDDPLWTLSPGASGDSDISERVDEVLYGDESA